MGLVQPDMFVSESSLQDHRRDADVVLVTPSAWSRAGLVRSGAEPSRVVVVPHGVDTSVFRPLGDDERAELRRAFGWDTFVFLHLGSMSDNKGIALLLKAFAQVLDVFPHAMLVLKGLDSFYSSGRYVERSLAGLGDAEQAKVRKRLAYVGGTLPFSELARLYQAADAYVSPYLAEAFNLPVLEAIASGLPVICTRGGPTDDFTTDDVALKIQSKIRPARTEEGGLGFALEPSLEHLIELMRQAIARRDLAVRARSEGPAFVATHFTWRHVVDRLLAVMMASRPGAPAPANRS
jgi:glycosyltransferase involved in cell wall biosynthesis